jgi:cellulose synthase/poly-beta-1,6-N-acetylglucosamine synthase-like glycosyltransferase
MLMAVQIIFWLSVGIILYTMLGYPLLITLVSRVRPRPIEKKPIRPTITLVIPAYNEERVIATKIENSLSLDYPKDKLEILVAADGSNDRTVEIASGYDEVNVYHQPDRRGKAAAINRVMPFVNGEIVVFSDADTIFSQDTLKAIAGSFADPAVGGVAGEKRVLGRGESQYWRYESYLKARESEAGSVVGAAGEVFAIRKAAFIPIDEDAIIEDFLMSMRMVEAGWRVVYEPKAVAHEDGLPNLEQDWGRRVRISAGGFQSIRRLGGLLNPRKGLIAWEYFSHRVLRWAATPFMLPLVLILNMMLWPKRAYRLPLLLQGLFYGAALLGYFMERSGRKRGVPFTIFYFCFVNLAAIAGFFRYLTGRQTVLWRKVR